MHRFLGKLYSCIIIWLFVAKESEINLNYRTLINQLTNVNRPRRMFLVLKCATSTNIFSAYTIVDSWTATISHSVVMSGWSWAWESSVIEKIKIPTNSREIFTASKLKSHKFSGHRQTRIYSELTNFSIHHSETWSTFPHHTRSRSSDNISFSWPYSLVPYFSTSPDTRTSTRAKAHQEREKVSGSNVKCYATFFHLSVGEMGRHFDIKFVFLVKWLEASRAALGRCQI